ncbi:MAG: hypothetical protein IJZ38_12960 [Bacteroides sp.]|nr:hypothetical protein [Bacteroides sp.]
MMNKDMYNVECVDGAVIISKSGPISGYRNWDVNSIHFRCKDRMTAVLLARLALGEWEELQKHDFDLIIDVNNVGYDFYVSDSDDEDYYEDEEEIGCENE